MTHPTQPEHVLRRAAAICLLLAGLLLLAACGGRQAEPTPTPTKTPEAVQQAPAMATPPAAAPTETQPAASQPGPVVGGVTVGVTVNVDQLNVRGGPSGDYEVVRTVSRGEQFQAIARTADAGWIQLALNGEPIGFSASQFFDVQGDLAALPALALPDVASQPTAAAAQPPRTTSGSALSPSMSSPDFGGQAFLWWRPEIADRDLTLMNEAGFRWVKQSFAWETIEGAGKGRFDWEIADRVVTHVADHGLKLLARVGVDPELTQFWAGHPPQNGDHFADYLFALASRYNCTPQAVGCIQAYQIWNEPNLAREWGGNRPNPAEYVAFLGKAYQAVKRANPNAIVINAGMAPTGDSSALAMPDDLFYDQMYQAMGGSSSGYFDKLGVHGAGFAAPPELDPAEAAANPKYGGYRFFAFRHVEDIRAIMVRYGDSAKQIVILEFGWTYDPVNPSYAWHGAEAGITDFVQADYLHRAYQYAAANWQPWIGLMSLLTMPNLDWLNDGNPQDEEQYWWAILEPSQINELKLRPAFVVLCVYFNSVSGQRCKYDPS